MSDTGPREMTKLFKPLALRVALIVASDRNRAIGKGNALPWKHKGDMACFRNTTLTHTVLMGRKTYESLGKRRLPGRHNLVLSKGISGYVANDPPLYPSKEMTSFQVVGSPQEALDYADRIRTLVGMAVGHEPQLFVIGGQTVYETFLPIADVVYHNVIETEIEGADAWFPEMDVNEWRTNHQIKRPAEGDDLAWRETVYVRSR